MIQNFNKSIKSIIFISIEVQNPVSSLNSDNKYDINVDLNIIFNISISIWFNMEYFILTCL